MHPEYSGLWLDNRVMFGQKSCQMLQKTLASDPLRYYFDPGARAVLYTLTYFRVKGRRPKVQFIINTSDSRDTQRYKFLKYKYHEFTNIIRKNIYNIYRCYCDIQKISLYLGIQLMLSCEHKKSLKFPVFSPFIIFSSLLNNSLFHSKSLSPLVY